MIEDTPPQETPTSAPEAPLPGMPAPGALPPPPPPPIPPRVSPHYPPSYPPPRARAPWIWGCGLGLAGCLLLVMIGILVSLVGVMSLAGGFGKAEAMGGNVALIRIEGEISFGSSDFSPFSSVAAGADEVIQQLEEAIKDKNAKAILVRVNSPGGSAAASQEIYNALMKAKQKKPIVVSMADVAASGGYYVAAPADVIFANPSTMTGSIGVISMHENFAGLLDKLGIRTEIIKSGALKDMGQPTGPLSEEARAVLKSVIMQVYNQFVDDVAKGRKMDRKQVLALADGRIYTGQQARQNGLIDKLGGMQEALLEAGKLGHVKGTPELEDYSAPNLLRDLLGFKLKQSPRPVAITGTLLYDWMAAQLVGGWRQPNPATPQVGPGTP